MNKNVLKVIDITIILVVLVFIIVNLNPVVQTLMLKNAKGNDDKIEKNVETIGDIELMIAQYYNQIQDGNLKGVNEICSFNNKKDETEIKNIFENVGEFENVRVKATKVYQLTNSTYKAIIILKEKDSLEDNEDFYEVTINLNSNRKQFKIIADKWN